MLGHAERKERRREMARLVMEHPEMTLKDIAQRFNVSRSTVHLALREYHPDIKRKKTPRSMVCDAMYQAYKNGRSYSDIARSYGVTRQAVHLAVQRRVGKGDTDAR